jgi:hypothetical protein
MNLKEEKCVLIYAPLNEKSSLIINELLDSNLRLRILTNNLKGFKHKFFYIWEKFESVTQIDINPPNFKKQREKYFEPRNGIAPEYVIFLKLQDSDENSMLSEMELINFFKTKKQIKKLIYVKINNKKGKIQSQSNLFVPSAISSDLEKSKNYLDNIYDYYIEAAIRQSGINYLIIQNLKVPSGVSVLSEDNMVFNNITDIILNDIYSVKIENFKELILKVLSGKIFVDDSMYSIEKSSYDDIIKYSTPQYLYDYYNFIYKDNFLRKIKPEINIIKDNRDKSRDYVVFSLLSIGFGLKVLSNSLRFFINYYK